MNAARRRTAALTTALLMIGIARLYCQDSASGNKLRPGDHRIWLTIGELRREFFVHVPAGYDGKRPVPLLFMFHGSGGSLDEIASATGWKLKSEEETFLAVFPNGFPNSDGMRVWSDGRAADDSRVDDVAFVRAMLDQLSSRFRVDQNRVFVVGFSNGAGLSYRLATEMGDRIASIAPVAGRLNVAPQELRRVVPALSIVGTEDPGFESDGRAAKHWAELAGCGAAGDTVRNGRYASVAYQHCPAKVDVISYAVDGWAHYWPGGRNPGVEMWAEKTIWDFFRKHPLR